MQLGVLCFGGLLIFTPPVVVASPLGSSNALAILDPNESPVGARIFRNETGGNRLMLVHWNDGEDFPSLGIGHFIWYPQGYAGPFDETFPALVRFYLAQGYTLTDLPALMTATAHAPWASQQKLLAARAAGDADLFALIAFLEATMATQVAFIFTRLEAALPKMMTASNRPEHVKLQFYRVAKSEGGFYALIDYVNFKGEGTKLSERYNGTGWGLLQVLEGMGGDEPGGAALTAFAHSAIAVLSARIANSPPERGEERWRIGWTNRCLTYRGQPLLQRS